MAIKPPETPAEVEVGALLGTEAPTFVAVPREQALEDAATEQQAAEVRAQEEAESAFPIGRPTLAVCFAMLAVAVMIGGMFLGWRPRVFAAFGGLEGALLAYYTARARNFWRAFLLSAAGIAIATVLAMLIGEGTGSENGLVVGFHDLANAPALVQKAVESGHVLRPPAPFDPGWRPLIVYMMCSLGYTAGWVACGLRRPPLGLLIPLPVLIFAAISQSPQDQVIDGIAAFALMAVALTVLYRETSESGARLSVAFEVRRTAKSLPLLGVIIVALVVLTRFGGFLFPAPAYDPTQAAQLPKAVPLGDVPDRPMFTVTSAATGPWRTGVLDVYDPQGAFRIPPYAQSRLAHISNDGYINRILKPGVKADFTIKNLDGAVLPSPTRPIDVLQAGNELNYDDRTGTIRLGAGQLREGVTYGITAAAAPTPDELKAAQPDISDTLDLQVPTPPDAVTRFLAGAPPSGWERADWVHKEFLKRVTLAGSGLPAPVPPSKVADMLEGSKEGSPFEIVAGQVLLERWAGIPARIGYGYDKGTKLDDGSQELRPKNGSSWLEVNFKDQGWFPVTGTPLHAKSSVGNKNVTNTDQNVLPSDEIAVQLFIPIDQVTPAVAYEQIRPLVGGAILALLAVAIVYVLWPAVFKAFRRTRRRSWALRTGRRARIAVAYAEFRELAIDLGDNHYAETPLHYVDHVVEDLEHSEFAWMVTRLLWGDLVGKATDDDVHAADEMSRSLRKRMARAQPLSVRLLAIVSRLSLKHPYAVGLEYRGSRERKAA